jgi:hypothetical protein
MKTIRSLTFIFPAFLCCILFSRSIALAEEIVKPESAAIKGSMPITLISMKDTGINYFLSDASENKDASSNTSNTSPGNSSFNFNWHKILGWTTAGMAVITIASGAAVPKKGHCAIAGVTSGLATATCITGYYKYGGLISLTNGDWKINTHAILGTIATTGFITATALAGKDGRKIHVITGAASGAAFGISLAILYF